MPVNVKKKKKPGEEESPILGQSPAAPLINKMGLFRSSSSLAPPQPQMAAPDIAGGAMGYPPVPPQAAEILAEKRKQMLEGPMSSARKKVNNSYGF